MSVCLLSELNIIHLRAHRLPRKEGRFLRFLGAERGESQASLRVSNGLFVDWGSEHRIRRLERALVGTAVPIRNRLVLRPAVAGY